MSTKPPSQKVISVCLPQALLDDIDARAASIGLSRSAYLGLLAQHDLTKAGPPPLPIPGATEPPKPVDLTALAYDFLLLAIPALEKYTASLEGAGQGPPPPLDLDPPEDPAITRLWQFFLCEMDEILRHKYLRSKQAGYDIGLSAAIQEWLQKHHALWAASPHSPLKTEN